MLGANVHARDANGEGVFSMIFSGYPADMIPRVTALFSRGAREPHALLTLVDTSLDTRWSLTRFKVDTDGRFDKLDTALEPLFSDVASIDSLTATERTQLLYDCAKQGFDRCAIALILRESFDPESFDFDMCSLYAASTGCTGLLKILYGSDLTHKKFRRKASISFAPAPFKQSALHLACIHGNAGTAFVVLDAIVYSIGHLGYEELELHIDAKDSMGVDAHAYAARWGKKVRGMDAVVGRIEAFDEKKWP